MGWDDFLLLLLAFDIFFFGGKQKSSTIEAGRSLKLKVRRSVRVVGIKYSKHRGYGGEIYLPEMHQTRQSQRGGEAAPSKGMTQVRPLRKLVLKKNIVRYL